MFHNHAAPARAALFPQTQSAPASGRKAAAAPLSSAAGAATSAQLRTPAPPASAPLAPPPPAVLVPAAVDKIHGVMREREQRQPRAVPASAPRAAP